MDTFWSIVQVSLPALLVGGIVWLMMSKFSEQENQRRRWQLLRTTQQTALPIRFTAYERMVIFLERITPDCMMVRLQDNALTAKQFHASLLVDIRAEYEHNVSQQLYMSDEAWAVVKNAKESIVQLVNACAAQLPPCVRTGRTDPRRKASNRLRRAPGPAGPLSRRTRNYTPD